MDISKFLDPKYDLTFKRIFGSEKNKNILIHFLNDILEFKGENAIQDVEFLSTISNSEIAPDKQSIVDVRCKDSNGNRYIVKMQLSRDKGFEKRAQLYAAKAYSRQSGNYIDFKKVFFIAIANCNIFPGEVEYISTHTIRDTKTNGHYLKDFQYVFIELPKFTKTKVEQLENMIERWCFFFRYADKTTDEDLKEIAEQGPVIKLAYGELNKFHWNEKDLAAYEERVMNVYIEANIRAHKLDIATQKGIQIGEERGIQIGEERGKKLGKEEGEKQATIKMAKAMLARGMNANTIAELTGLTMYEVEGLK